MRNGLSCGGAGKIGYEKSNLRNIVRLKKEKCRLEYEQNPFHCKTCGEKIPYEKRFNVSFCSSSCSAKHNNVGVRRHGKPRGKCLNCGKENKESNRIYCCQKCNSTHKWGITKKEIEGVGKTPPSSVVAKRYLRDADGISCKICGITDWMGKEVPLVLDHIDGNSENWLISNLRLICGNCDMQTPTYKGKNRGNGRFFRRLRRQQGKSY